MYDAVGLATARGGVTIWRTGPHGFLGVPMCEIHHSD